MIQNIVVVRFSLRVSDWHNKAYGEECNRKSWFAFRAKIFNDGLLKSCLNQTIVPRKIYLMMDEFDEELYGRYIDNTEGCLTPIYSKNNNHGEQMAIDLQCGDTNEVAMSRIDSDDLISEKYFEAINAAILKAKVDGICFDYVISTDGYVTDMKYINKIVNQKSPFLTLYREQYTGESVYGFDHSTVLEKKHVACSSAHWIQIYHGSNIGNRFEKRHDSRSVHEFWPGHFHCPEWECYEWPSGTRV